MNAPQFYRDNHEGKLTPPRVLRLMEAYAEHKVNEYKDGLVKKAQKRYDGTIGITSHMYDPNEARGISAIIDFINQEK